VVVGVGEKTRIDLGHAAEEPLLAVGQRGPRLGDVHDRERLAVWSRARLGRADGVDRRQLRVGRHKAHLLLARQGLLAQRLVARVETALVLVAPLLGRVVRRVTGAGCVVEKERLVGGDRLGILDELEGLVGDVVGEVVALLRGLRRVDRVIVVDEVGIPLVGLGAEKPYQRSKPRPLGQLRRGAARFISSVGQRCHLPTM